jgi:hypothetical protein
LAAAARYLGVPVVAVLAMAGAVTLRDLEWPGAQSRELRLRLELDALEADPYYGGLVPHSLRSASADVQLFVIYLYREALSAFRTTRTRPAYWAMMLDAVEKSGIDSSDSGQSMF